MGFVRSLSLALGGVDVKVLPDAEYLGALGAALFASEAAG